MSISNYSSYQGSEVMEEKSFEKTAQTIGSNIQKISQNVSSLKRMVNLLGTSQDSHEVRQQLKNIQQYTQQLVKDTSNSLNILNSISVSPDQRQWRMQKERLTDEYTAALNMFQSTQRDALRKESVQAKKKRAEMNSHSSGMLPPPPIDPFRDDIHANQLIELQNDRSKSTSHMQIQFEAEKYNLQQLEEQEEAIRNLERDISDVNEIYKSLGRLVHEQGETIDSIEANIERSHVTIRQATSELRKAGEYMISVESRRWAQKLANERKLYNSPSGEFGENLYMGNYYTGLIYPSLIVHYWYKEVNHYRNYKPEENLRRAGNFTQIIWKNTRNLGMGYAFNHAYNEVYVVCNYEPPGNILQEYSSNIKEPINNLDIHPSEVTPRNPPLKVEFYIMARFILFNAILLLMRDLPWPDFEDLFFRANTYFRSS